MDGSSHIKDQRDNQVNYNIAEDRFFFFSFLNLNKFFINGVTAISSYQYLWRDSTGGKTITDSFTQFHHLISDHAFWNKINFLGYLINQKQVIAVGVNPGRHNEISPLRCDKMNCVSLLELRDVMQTGW